MDEFVKELKLLKFDKQLKKLTKKFKNKKIVIYGTGLFFRKILENYDLSNLNIIGVSDKKYTFNQEGEEDYGYKIIPLEKIVDYKPDIILISTVKFLNIMEDFKYNLFKGSKITILPLVDKPFFTLLKEIFG